MQSGMSRTAAAIAARQRFGNLSSVQERCREQNGALAIETIWQDLRFACRTFAAQPGFTAVVLTTLALGIGANTAVFSVLQAVLLQPLPVREPERLVFVWENDRLRKSEREGASFPDYLDMKQRAKSFEHLAASQRMDVTLTGQGEPERVVAARVTSNYFEAMGVQPLLGRVFKPGEAGVLLSNSLWQTKFGASRDVLGQAVSLDGFSGTILGVMAPAADSLAPRSAQVWSALEAVRATQFRGQHNTRVIGRLRHGSNVQQAQAELTGIMSQLEKEYPDDNLGRGAMVIPAHEELAGTMRPALKALSAAVIVLLLIACVNVANLLLARASSRGHEMAVRYSLGAARGRLMRQLLTESLLLALAGGVLGVFVAYWGVQGLISMAPLDIPLIGRTSIDATSLLTTLCVSLAAWVLFGLAPAWKTYGMPAASLRSSGRSSASGSSLRLRHALVTAEIGLAAVLVIFSGVLIRSFWRMHQVNLGYVPAGAITLRVKLPESRYPFPKFPWKEWPAATAFYGRLKSAALQIPGVQIASVANAGPERTSWTTRVTVEGRPVPPEGEQDEAQFRTSDTDYLRATGAALRSGRFFGQTDDERHPLVSVVNEAFVRRHFPSENPIGRRIKVFGSSREIVGVIGDIRYGSPDAEPSPSMYFPIVQSPFPDATLIVRTSGDPSLVAPGLRGAVLAADPAVAPFDVMTLEHSLSEATARQRFILTLLTGFGCIALALAAIGIYGVVSYTVGQRRQETAVRMALGARGQDVFSEIVRGMLARTFIGIGAGIAVAGFATRMLQPLLFETSPRDSFTYAAVAAGLVAVAFVGAALPAQTAARMNPAAALRQE